MSFDDWVKFLITVNFIGWLLHMVLFLQPYHRAYRDKDGIVPFVAATATVAALNLIAAAIYLDALWISPDSPLAIQIAILAIPIGGILRNVVHTGTNIWVLRFAKRRYEQAADERMVRLEATADDTNSRVRHMEPQPGPAAAEVTLAEVKVIVQATQNEAREERDQAGE